MGSARLTKSSQDLTHRNPSRRTTNLDRADKSLKNGMLMRVCGCAVNVYRSENRGKSWLRLPRPGIVEK